MTVAEALNAACLSFGGLTVAVVGWMIIRAVGRVDSKVDALIARDGAQDLALVELRTRVTTLEVEVATVRLRVADLTLLTAQAGLGGRPATS